MLGQFPQAPNELLVSIEADVFSLRDPADSDLIDGSIGEGSAFHQTFGYYAHGVSVETAVLPSGWQDRLVPVRGKIRNLLTGHETLFRLWLDSASDSVVPVRFEVQPRSFLRLTFEAV